MVQVKEVGDEKAQTRKVHESESCPIWPDCLTYKVPHPEREVLEESWE